MHALHPLHTTQYIQQDFFQRIKIIMITLLLLLIKNLAVTVANKEPFTVLIQEKLNKYTCKFEILP